MNIRSIFCLRNPSKRLVRAPLNQAFIVELPGNCYRLTERLITYATYHMWHMICANDVNLSYEIIIRNILKAFLAPKAIVTAPIHSGPNPHVMKEKLNVLVMYDKEFPVKIVRGIRNNCRLSSIIKRKVFWASDKIEKCSSRGFTDVSLISQHIKNASTINPLNQHDKMLNRVRMVLNWIHWKHHSIRIPEDAHEHIECNMVYFAITTWIFDIILVDTTSRNNLLNCCQVCFIWIQYRKTISNNNCRNNTTNNCCTIEKTKKYTKKSVYNWFAIDGLIQNYITFPSRIFPENFI